MSNEELYAGREQTLVKHFVFQKYLERFSHIVGTNWDTLTYVDCFSGPWNARSEKFDDSSFGIALNELRRARDTHAARGRKLRLRCFFLEKEPSAYTKLRGFVEGIADIHIETLMPPWKNPWGPSYSLFRREGQGRFLSFLLIRRVGRVSRWIQLSHCYVSIPSKS